MNDKKAPVWMGRMGFLHKNGGCVIGSTSGGALQPAGSWAVRCPAYGVWLAPPDGVVGNQAWSNDARQAQRYATEEEAQAVAMMHASLGFEVYAVQVDADGNEA